MYSFFPSSNPSARFVSFVKVHSFRSWYWKTNSEFEEKKNLFEYILSEVKSSENVYKTAKIQWADQNLEWASCAHNVHNEHPAHSPTFPIYSANWKCRKFFIGLFSITSVSPRRRRRPAMEKDETNDTHTFLSASIQRKIREKKKNKTTNEMINPN